MIDELEPLAVERAKALFGVEHANVQPYSGSPANLAVYLAFLEPGDTVMGMALPMGGHLTHGWGVSVTGKWFRAVQYGVAPRHGRRRPRRGAGARARRRGPSSSSAAAPPSRARSTSPASRPSRPRSTPCSAADIAHIAGLIAGGAHPSPVGHAQVVSTTTHKTLRGPRGAMLMCGAEQAQAIDRAVFPGLQGGPHNHTTAAIAVALHEAAQPAFAAYARQVVANARALAEALVGAGLRARVRRHRQPPDPHRPDLEGDPRQARRPGARPGRDHAQLQHRALRSPQALRPLGGAAGDAGGDDSRDGRRPRCARSRV